MSSQPSSRANRLPSRFPVGTRYVVEGRAGHIHLRYLEFPDGRQIELPADLADRSGSRVRLAGRGRRSRTSRK